MGFWSWFTLITGIVAVVAFLMAVSPFISMYRGRPKIKIEFEQREVDRRMVPECLLTNEPTSWFLCRILGVERKMADDVWAGFTIRESATNKIIASPTLVPLARDGFAPASHISLPSSLLPMARFLIAFQREDKKGVVIAEKDNLQILPTGSYYADVAIFISGKAQGARREFVVHEGGMMHWLN